MLMHTSCWWIAVMGAAALMPQAEQGSQRELINLGRTSLASVDASGVNGGRSLSSPHYGVLNAFDDGENRIDGLPYSSWLDHPGNDSRVQVRFDRPVTVVALKILRSPPVSARLKRSNGEVLLLPGTPPARAAVGDKDALLGALLLSLDQLDRDLPLPAPLSEVLEVELIFPVGESVGSVEEILILGHVPPGSAYTVGLPRIELTPRNVGLMADEAFLDWLQAALREKPKRIEESATHWIHTFALEGVPVMRVSIDKRTGERAVTRLAPGAPLESTPSGR